MEKGGGGLQQNPIVLIRVIFQTDWRPFTVFLIMLHERLLYKPCKQTTVCFFKIYFFYNVLYLFYSNS